VLVNDFGAVNIDAELLRESGEEILALENGCICCSLGAGLLATLSRVVRRADPPDRILVEASGIADPAEIAATLADPELRPYAPLDGIVTVVDAAASSGLDASSRALADRQTAMASLVVLNKLDLAADPALARARAMQLAPLAALIETSYGRLPLASIIDLGGAPGADAAMMTTAPEFESVSVETPVPIPLRRIHALLQALPRGILRVKGSVNLVEKSQHRTSLQVASGRATLRVGAAWSGSRPETRLIFIGQRDIPDATTLRSLLVSAVTEVCDAE
jgi:G3E family GTPase